MNSDRIMPAINDIMEAGWTSGGITIEQKSTDAPEVDWYVKYFHDKDDAEMGGHWNVT